MGKIWVLDTGTKGTGAEMVPLEKVLREAGPGVEPVVATRTERRPAEPEPRQPQSFKVMNVMTREVIGEHLDARSAVDALAGFGSIFDVRIYAWDPRLDDWRMLSHGDQRLLWERRGRARDPDW